MGRRIQRRAGFVSAGLLALLAFGAAPRTGAQPAPSEAAVKAAYLFRVAGYIKWPGRGLDDHAFVIDVMGDADVARELRRLLPGHLIASQVVEVREVTQPKDVQGAQILYVGPDHDEFLRALHRRIVDPTLLVTNEEHGLDLGAMLNFVTVDNHVRFEISLTAAEAAHLKISAELLAVAIRVHGGGRQTNQVCLPCWRAPDRDTLCGEYVSVRSPTGLFPPDA